MAMGFGDKCRLYKMIQHAGTHARTSSSSIPAKINPARITIAPIIPHFKTLGWQLGLIQKDLNINIILMGGGMRGEHHLHANRNIHQDAHHHNMKINVCVRVCVCVRARVYVPAYKSQQLIFLLPFGKKKKKKKKTT